MRGSWCVSTIALFGLLLPSCGDHGPPPLDQSYRCDGTYEGCSSLIVVGTITAVRPTGREAEVNADNGIVKGPGRTWLFEVKTKVEDVLKGNLADHSITFYYYGLPWNMAAVGSQAFMPRAGWRYVLKLRRERNALRTVVDWAAWPHERVYTGYHSPGFLDPRWTVEERIAQIVLIPGTEFDRTACAQNLDRAASHSESLIGPLKTMQMLQSLLTRSECEIRSAACVVLAQYYPGHDACLSAVARDHCLSGLAVSVTLALDIQRWQAEADLRAERLVSEINDPGVPIRGGPPEYRLQFLEILAAHPDKRVASAARAVLDKSRGGRR
jgi:hypothetical protein